MISEQTPIPCSPPLITRVYPSERCTPGAFGLGCVRAGDGVGGEGRHAFIKPHLISDPNTFLELSRCFQERYCFQNARPSHIKVSGMPVGELELPPKRDQSGRGLGFIWPIKEAILQQSMTAFASCGYFSTHNRKWHSMAKDNGSLSRTPWVRPKSAISILKRDDEHSGHFNMGIPPRKNTIPCWPNQFITWLST